MRTENITAVADLASVLANMNMNVNPIPQVETGKDFKAVMVSKVSNTASQSEGRRADVAENSARDILTSKPNNIKPKTENEADEEVISETVANMVAVVTEKLDITPEELADTLSELSMDLTDLALNDKAAQFIAQIKEVDSVEIVTNEELTELLSEITSEVGQIITETAEANDIPLENLVDKLKDKAGELINEEESEVFTTFIRDEDTGKEIKVTFENNKGSRPEAVKSETIHVENQPVAEAPKREKNESNSEEQMSGSQNNAAQNLISKLSESISETQSVGSTFTEPYVSAEDIMKQMIDAIRVNVTADTSSMELQLTPESLGKINLNVTTRDGMVTATITAQNDAVKAVIESQLVELKENLNNQGLKVSNVEVAVASHGFDFNHEEARDDNSHQSRRSGSRFRGLESLPDEEAEVEEDNLEARGSSVSYRA